MLEFSEEKIEEMKQYIKTMEEQENKKHQTLKKDLKDHSFVLSSIQKLIDSETKTVFFDSNTIFTSEEFERLFSVLELITDLTGTSYEDLNRHFPTNVAAVLFGDYVIKIETMYGQGTMSSIQATLVSESELPTEILENSYTLQFLLKHGAYLLENENQIREKRKVLDELNENLDSIKKLLNSEFISFDSKSHLSKAMESLKKSIEDQEVGLKLY